MVGRDVGQCQTMSKRNIRKIQNVLQAEIVLSVHASSHWGGCTRSIHHGIPKLPGDLPSTHLFPSPCTSLHSAFSQCQSHLSNIISASSSSWLCLHLSTSPGISGMTCSYFSEPWNIFSVCLPLTPGKTEFSRFGQVILLKSF